MKKLIIIESILAKPHLETAGEIALRFSNNPKYNNVSFSWIGKDIHFTDWDYPIFHKLYRYYISKRLKIFLDLLSKNRIRIIPCPDLGSNDLIYIEKWVSRFSPKNITSLRNYKYKNFYLGRGVASSLISYFQNVNLDLLKNINLVKSLLFSSAMVFERCKRIIEIEKPTTIITFNGRFSISLPILLLAKKFNIKLLRHERGSSFNKFEIFTEDIHNPNNQQKAIFNYWKKKDKNRFKIGRKFFYDRRFDKKKGLGINLGYSYVKNQKENYLREDIVKLSYNKRLIAYFTSTDHEKQAESYNVDQQNKFKNFISILSLFKDVHLVIRVHPGKYAKDKIEDLNWTQFSSDNVSVINSDDKTDTYKVLELADIVVSYGSNIIIESLFWGKKTILLNNNTVYSKFNSRVYPNNNKELKNFLRKEYKYKKISKKECLPYGYYFKTFGTLYKYYKPKNYFEGRFLGVNLDKKPRIVSIIKNLLPIKIYNFLLLTLKKFNLFLIKNFYLKRFN